VTVDEDTSVSFDGTSSTDNGKIDNYEWDWTDDGTYESTGESPSHTYADPGTYTVRLRVTDGNSNTATDTLSVTVESTSSGGGGGASSGSGDSGGDDSGADGTSDTEQPSGETDENEEFVEPSEMEEVDIVDVQLATAPANSVNATSIVTLDNPSTADQTVDVRFVINGDVVEERDVVVPAEERINATHSEIIEEAGTHEVAANVATTAGDGTTVRTFDFEVGVVELDEDGTEIASSSADPPSAPADADTGENQNQQESDGGGVSGLAALLGLVAVVAVLSGALYWRRRTG
jgi:PKD repeat protein